MVMENGNYANPTSVAPKSPNASYVEQTSRPPYIQDWAITGTAQNAMLKCIPLSPPVKMG